MVNDEKTGILMHIIYKKKTDWGSFVSFSLSTLIYLDVESRPREFNVRVRIPHMKYCPPQWMSRFQNKRLYRPLGSSQKYSQLQQHKDSKDHKVPSTSTTLCNATNWLQLRKPNPAAATPSAVSDQVLDGVKGIGLDRRRISPRTRQRRTELKISMISFTALSNEDIHLTALGLNHCPSVNESPFTAIYCQQWSRILLVWQTPINPMCDGQGSFNPRGEKGWTSQTEVFLKSLGS